MLSIGPRRESVNTVVGFWCVARNAIIEVECLGRAGRKLRHLNSECLCLLSAVVTHDGLSLGLPSEAWCIETQNRLSHFENPPKTAARLASSPWTWVRKNYEPDLVIIPRINIPTTSA